MAIESRPVTALVNKENILERVAKGERLIDIAQSFGLTSHSSISKYLASDPDFIEARKAGLESLTEQREKELEAADSSVTVARARELLSHARWRAERLDPSRWGQRTQVTVEHVGDLGDRLRRSRERVIEAEPVADAQHAAVLPAQTEGSDQSGHSQATDK